MIFLNKFPQSHKNVAFFVTVYKAEGWNRRAESKKGSFCLWMKKMAYNIKKLARYERRQPICFPKLWLMLVYERVIESFNWFQNADSFRSETPLLCVALRCSGNQLCSKTMLLLKVYEIVTIPKHTVQINDSYACLQSKRFCWLKQQWCSVPTHCWYEL